LENYALILGTLAGLGLGILLAWFSLRQQRDLALSQLETRLNTIQAEKQQELASRLAAAEEKNSRLPELLTSLHERDQALTELHKLKSDAEAHVASLEARLSDERDQTREKLAVLDDAQRKLTDTFQALSAQALAQNNQSFLDLAKTAFSQIQEKASGEINQKHSAIADLLKPVQESLSKVDNHIHELEKARSGAYESLITQVKSLTETQANLKNETGNLVRALHSPVVRGRWGEIQLKRVVELAGMIEHCDFFEQESVNTETGQLRPDMLVKMPGGKTIIVDAKASINAYLESLELSDPAARLERLKRHSHQVRDHVKKLGSKDYSSQFAEAPEFVVLFLPGEMFFSAALEQDPTLIEFGADRRVILATPTTLIALLRAVHYGWRQERLAENAEKISDLGRELYERIATLGEYIGKLGRHLDAAVDAYNKAATNIESRVLVTARKFKDLQADIPNREIKTIEPVDHATRKLQAPEMVLEPELSLGIDNEPEKKG